ncbi:MAG TPA: DUF58 domain-containing protein [Gemmatimonadaceae bacterium]
MDPAIRTLFWTATVLALVAALVAALVLRARPTRRAAALVALVAPLWLLSGTAVGAGAAMIATGVVLAALVADLLFVPGRASVAVERRLSGTIGLGDETRGEVAVTSLWPYRVRARVHDELSPAVAPASGDIAAALGEVRLEPGMTATVPLAVRGLVRGGHRLGRIVLDARGPLGLVRRLLIWPASGEVTVIPSLAGVRRLRLQALQQRMREAGARVVRRRGGGTSFAGLREYALGDDPRRVDWKASARRDTLVTREYTVEQGQTVVIAVDAGRMMTQLAGEHSRFEHALSAALVLADVAIRSGDQVGLLVFDDEVRAFVPPGRGAAALAKVRDALVVAQARLVEPDYAGAFRTLAARHRRRSLLVLFTDVVDARSSQSILAHTARSAVRHLPLVVALRNDQLEAAAIPAPGDSSDRLYESAAAEELLTARAEALARMRRQGVGVLDISPETLTAAVVNRYLEIKGRAAL